MALAAGTLVLVASPAHRTFYLGGERGRPPAGPAPGASAPLARTASPPAAGGPEPAALDRDRSGLSTDAGGRLSIPLAERLPGRLPAAGVPAGWVLREFTGRAGVELVQSEIGLALSLASERSSFVLYRDVVVDLRQFPLLGWWWKVTRLPPRGDGRQPATDDQAAQVYVVFPRWPSPSTRSDVIGYVWDSNAPVGTPLRNPRAPNVRILVVDSGRDGLGAWRRQQRHVLEDYGALFGGAPPRVGAVALMIDTDHTGGAASALFGDMAFMRAPSSVKGEASMLR